MKAASDDVAEGSIDSVSTDASPWPVRTSRQRTRDLKREAVIRAAARAFSERGYHNTSIDEIAAALNVTKPTIYYYVANKEQLLLECILTGLERVLAPFQPAPSRRDERPRAAQREHSPLRAGHRVRVRRVHGARRGSGACTGLARAHQETQVRDRPRHPAAPRGGCAGRLDRDARSEDERLRTRRRPQLDCPLVSRESVHDRGRRLPRRLCASSISASPPTNVRRRSRTHERRLHRRKTGAVRAARTRCGSSPPPRFSTDTMPRSTSCAASCRPRARRSSISATTARCRRS